MGFCRETFQSRFRRPDALAAGMAASLIIHAILVSLLSMIPASGMDHAARTIAIRFEQGAETAPGGPVKIKRPGKGKTGPRDGSAAAARQSPRTYDNHATFQESPAPQPLVASRESAVVHPGPVMEPAAIGSGTRANPGRNESPGGVGKPTAGGPVETAFGAAGAPSFVRRETPLYPIIARRFGKEGKVVLKLFIDEKGRLLNIEVLEGAGYGFLEAAVDAVRKSVFAPAVRNGENVSSKAVLPVRFQLKDL